MASRKDDKGYVLWKGESKRKDGYYIYQYKDLVGRRRVAYAKDLPTLRKKEKEIIKDLNDGIDTYASENTTLNMAFERCMMGKANLKESTCQFYQYIYDLIIRKELGQRKVKSIKYSELKAFYLSLLVSGKLNICTVSSVHTILHATFKMLIRDEIIRVNPADDVLAEIKKSGRWKMNERHALTVDQQRIFLQYIHDDSIFSHWYPLFAFFLSTGCRATEALAICWSDIDFTKKEIQIRRNLLYRKRPSGEYGFYITTPKTKKSKREIPMIDKLEQILREEYERQKQDGFCKAVVDGKKGFVFMNRNGGVFRSETINSAIRRIYRAYNKEETLKAMEEHREPILLPHFSCHHLRHTFCTRYCEVEPNARIVQEVMGHSNIITTMNIYAEVTESTKHESLERCQNNFMI